MEPVHSKYSPDGTNVKIEKKQTAETTLRCFLNVLRFFSGCKNVLTTVLFHFSQSEIRM